MLSRSIPPYQHTVAHLPSTALRRTPSIPTTTTSHNPQPRQQTDTFQTASAATASNQTTQRNRVSAKQAGNVQTNEGRYTREKGNMHSKYEMIRM